MAEFNGLRHRTTSENEFNEMVMMIQDSGYYYLTISKGDVRYDSVDNEVVFKQLTAERLKEWIQIAKTRLEGSGLKVYITGGNDDYLELDSILESSDSMIFSESRLQVIEGNHE